MADNAASSSAAAAAPAVTDSSNAAAEPLRLDSLSVAQLSDISWKFGVSAASSEQKTMGSCFLQFSITTQQQADGKGKKTTVMELSLPQFYAFLQQMQLAHRQVQNLTK